MLWVFVIRWCPSRLWLCVLCFFHFFFLSVSSVECLLTGWHAALGTTLTFTTRRAGYERECHKRRVTKLHCSAGPPPPVLPDPPWSGSLWCKAAPRVLQLALKQQFLEAERREGSLFERIRSHLLLLLLTVPSSQLFGFRSQIAPLKRRINPFIFPHLSPNV